MLRYTLVAVFPNLMVNIMCRMTLLTDKHAPVQLPAERAKDFAAYTYWIDKVVHYCKGVKLTEVHPFFLAMQSPQRSRQRIL